MKTMMLHYRVGVLMTLASLSPNAADWLNQERKPDERGDVTVQNVIWIAIAAAGAFVIAVLLYNKFRTKAANLDVDNPGALPV
jgi:tryptophan-rich sensory protein